LDFVFFIRLRAARALREKECPRLNLPFPLYQPRDARRLRHDAEIIPLNSAKYSVKATAGTATESYKVR
jgi:hypothetical protein